ncbi:hypothetical protein IJT93_05165 [bacterium]|nr:hypothetical protein [bacterium]
MQISIPAENLDTLSIFRLQAQFGELPKADIYPEADIGIRDTFTEANAALAEADGGEENSIGEACTKAEKSEGRREEGLALPCSKSDGSISEAGGEPLPSDDNKAEGSPEAKSNNLMSSVPEVISMDCGPLFSVSLREPGANFEHGFLYFASEPQEEAPKEASPADGAEKPAPARRSAGRAGSKKTADPMGEKEEAALKEEMQQQDELRANEIYERMRIDRQIHEAKLQAMLADLQTELQRIWREAALRRRKMEDDLSKSWQKAVLGV